MKFMHTFRDKAVNEKNITVLFPDAIIINSEFRIVKAGSEVLDLLQYEKEEVKGAVIELFTRNVEVTQSIKNIISQCLTKKITLPLFTSKGQPFFFEISGFPLGMISDMDHLTLIRARNLGEAYLLHQELEETREELDSFIYRSSHELRGPVATIRGVLQLLKFRKDNAEVDEFIRMIDTHASLLDDRLGRLLYLENSASTFEPLNILNTELLKNSILDAIKEKAAGKVIKFRFRASFDQQNGINEQLVLSLVKNLIFYLNDIPNCQEIVFAVGMELKEKHLELKIVSNCWCHRSYQRVTGMKGVLYSGSLSNPELLNYYAALKVCQKMKAQIHFAVIPEANQQEISVSIPLNS